MMVRRPELVVEVEAKDETEVAEVYPECVDVLEDVRIRSVEGAESGGSLEVVSSAWTVAEGRS